MRAERVTEFVILSGPEVHDYLVAIRTQLRRYLSAAFPAYEFSLASQECEGMGFIITPVVVSADGDAVEPDEAALLEIKKALEGFRPSEAQMH